MLGLAPGVNHPRDCCKFPVGSPSVLIGYGHRCGWSLANLRYLSALLLFSGSIDRLRGRFAEQYAPLARTTLCLNGVMSQHNAVVSGGTAGAWFTRATLPLMARASFPLRQPSPSKVLRFAS
jgi:hypothetical protein